ncbi:PilZ domain-containing protein [Sphingomonas canadensis]|uniref:PilZ domain-containing protein n=1 Tax=Sphingomonas canadensis TaxID=1219257 RepID=A0ABW3HCH0_9SPHN|nr:PilZ domain-containing protein [Sphingomonas canadensis]MCW3838061.1 PilZ domain-containing protein [Sphingomonas canadensis]
MHQREPRRPVRIAAATRYDRNRPFATISNVSSRGMELRSATPPAPGTYLEIRSPAASFAARTVWSRGEAFGVRLQERIDVAALVEGRPQQRNDTASIPDEAAAARQNARREEMDERLGRAIVIFAALSVLALSSLLAWNALGRPALLP